MGGWFRSKPTRECRHALGFGIPPTAVGGLFISSLQESAPSTEFGIPPTAVGGLFIPSLFQTNAAATQTNEATRSCCEETRSRLSIVLFRLCMNDPPTAVGGIPNPVLRALSCRLYMNDPPTAVGGISRVFTQSPQLVVFPRFYPVSSVGGYF